MTADQAKAAAGHFVDYIKSKLPPALHNHIDSAVGGSSDTGSGLLQEGGEMLEKAKEKVEGFVSGLRHLGIRAGFEI